MTNGTIKFFNATKGFGFITPEDGSKDVFVPAASVTASGISALKPGQLVSFDTEPDSKGPKAVNLKLLADAPKPPPPPVRMPVREISPIPDAGVSRLTVFHDPASDASRIVLAALKAAHQDPRLVDYMATPPDRDALKNLSLLLRGGDQSLVRKYDPLFLELRLDDRFISDGEFWAAIVEHPSLINGPVIATAQKARVCRTENAVRAFLGIEQSAESPATAKPKGIPARMAPAAADTAVPTPVVKREEVRKTEAMPLEKSRAQAPAPKKAKAETKAKMKAEIKPQARTAPKAAPKAKATPKAAAKTVKTAKPVKKAAAKPVKKAKRAPKR